MSGVIRLTAEMVNEGGAVQTGLLYRPVNKKVRLTIYDTGMGIKEQDLKSLFKLFGKLHDPKQVNKEGTGLGLYITQNLLNQLGGTISVDSEYGKYTQFTINLSSSAE